MHHYPSCVSHIQRDAEWVLYFSCCFSAESVAMSATIHINSPNVKYTDTHIVAQYSYQTTSVHRDGNKVTVSPKPFTCISVCVCYLCSRSLTLLHMWNRWLPAQRRWPFALRGVCQGWVWCWWAGEATTVPPSPRLYWLTSWVSHGGTRVEWR